MVKIPQEIYISCKQYKMKTEKLRILSVYQLQLLFNQQLFISHAVQIYVCTLFLLRFLEAIST